MQKLDIHDLSFCVLRIPSKLKTIMKSDEWKDNIFIGGGFIRAIIAHEIVNDVDVFVKSQKDAELLAYKLSDKKEDIIKTDNAYTIKGKVIIQIIHRWVFEKPEDVQNSFDFTVCCSVIFFTEGKFDSFCDDRFYKDLAAKRLIYRSPIRNEDAGGSMLRVLKYYQRGYRIPLNSLAAVMARMVKELDVNALSTKDEGQVTKVFTGMLRVVDPNSDPTHEAHLPSVDEKENPIDEL